MHCPNYVGTSTQISKQFNVLGISSVPHPRPIPGSPAGQRWCRAGRLSKYLRTPGESTPMQTGSIWWESNTSLDPMPTRNVFGAHYVHPREETAPPPNSTHSSSSLSIATAKAVSFSRSAYDTRTIILTPTQCRLSTRLVKVL